MESRQQPLFRPRFPNTPLDAGAKWSWPQLRQPNQLRVFFFNFAVNLCAGVELAREIGFLPAILA